jgi:hypothetical protein
MPAHLTPLSGSVTTTARLNIRKGAPSTSAPITARAEPGTTLEVVGLIDGDSVSGNRQWYSGGNDAFFWSGACGAFRPSSTGTAPVFDVSRRPDGTIRVLSETEIRATYGDFAHTERHGGRIAIGGSWIGDNIVDLATPILTEEGFPSIQVHRKAAAPFQRAFAAIEQAGLQGLIRTCAGTFVPRHKGWDPNRGLSSHSWGIAIDLNVQWNGYGSVPAPLGAVGSVRELVLMFEAEGFGWGGYFQPASICDGMHFELARRDL